MVSDEAKLRLNETAKKNPELARRYLKKFDDILKDPFHFEILKGDLHDARKAKVYKQKYRIIFDIYPEENAVMILLIGHRKDIYRDKKLFEEFSKSKSGAYLED
jgi:Cytotoxic translational repressor of toxin-antitoxin stability system